MQGEVATTLQLAAGTHYLALLVYGSASPVTIEVDPTLQ